MAQSEQLLYTVTTDHETYRVVERQYEGRPARVLFSGERHAAQSGIGLDDDPDLLFDYNQRLLELANGHYAKRVLVLGGGAFTLPMALLAALPMAQIDVVELDQGLKDIAERYFGLRADDRLRLHFGDGRAYLETARRASYDLIIIDVFSELHIPEQFLTVEFVAMARRALAKGGVVAMNIIASYQGRNAGLIKSQIAAYAAQFDAVELFPAAYGLTSWLPQNLLLVAQRQPLMDMRPYIRFAPIALPEYSADDVYHDALTSDVTSSDR